MAVPPKSAAWKSASGYEDESPALQAFLKSLESLPGVTAAVVVDTWSDGYRRIHLGLEVKGGLDIRTDARGGYTRVFDIPNYPRTVRAVRTLLGRTRGISVENVTGPKKLYEALGRDYYPQTTKDGRLSGYDGKVIDIEVYDPTASVR